MALLLTLPYASAEDIPVPHTSFPGRDRGHAATVIPAERERLAGRTTISTCWPSDASVTISSSSETFRSLSRCPDIVEVEIGWHVVGALCFAPAMVNSLG
jgi:hypothetical protein